MVTDEASGSGQNRAKAKGKGKVKSESVVNESWKTTGASREFKVLACIQAGISSAKNASVKMYHLNFPSDPSQHPYHPVDFEPKGIEIGTDDAEVAGGAKRRYRMVRFDFTQGPDAQPNHAVLERFARHMAANPKLFFLPDGVTADSILQRVIHSTWSYWKRKFDERHTSAEDVALLEARRIEQQRKGRCASRLGAKGLNRLERAMAILEDNPAWKGQDRFQKSLVATGYQSLEDLDVEDDPITGKPSKVLQRHVPMYRSDEAMRFLHSLDKKRVKAYKVVESGQFYDLGQIDPGVGGRKWAVAAGWAARNPDAVEKMLLKSNKGPFPGSEGAVARGVDSFGSDPTFRVGLGDLGAAGPSSAHTQSQDVVAAGSAPRTPLSIRHIKLPLHRLAPSLPSPVTTPVPTAVPQRQRYNPYGVPYSSGVLTNDADQDRLGPAAQGSLSFPRSSRDPYVVPTSARDEQGRSGDQDRLHPAAQRIPRPSRDLYGVPTSARDEQGRSDVAGPSRAPLQQRHGRAGLFGQNAAALSVVDGTSGMLRGATQRAGLESRNVYVDPFPRYVGAPSHQGFDDDDDMGSSSTSSNGLDE